MPTIRWDADAGAHGIATVDVTDEYGESQPTSDRYGRAREVVWGWRPPDSGEGRWLYVGHEQADALTFTFAWSPRRAQVVRSQEPWQGHRKLPVTVITD